MIINDHRKFHLEDTVIVKEHGVDYGKICTIVEVSDNEELPVRVRLINPHDCFKRNAFGTDVTERWVSKRDLSLAERR